MADWHFDGTGQKTGGPAGGENAASERVYFRSVRVLPEYWLEVEMGTGTIIRFNFGTRLKTVRFGALQDKALFASAHTDGEYLIFRTDGRVPVKITASEFMDLVLVDRTK